MFKTRRKCRVFLVTILLYLAHSPPDFLKNFLSEETIDRIFLVHISNNFTDLRNILEGTAK